MKKVVILGIMLLLSACSQSPENSLVERSSAPAQTFEQNDDKVAEDGSPITIYIARSDDGITFDDPEAFVEGGGVPSITRGEDGTLVAVFNWFGEEYDPETHNKVAVKISKDNGESWTEPEVICLAGFPEELQWPYDPTITVTEKGQYRLFFTTHILGIGEPFYYGSALSNDGVTYKYEEGKRFSYDGKDIVDGSEVLLEDGTWYMLAPFAMESGKAVDAISSDGLTFTQTTSNREEDFENMHWVGNMVNVDGTIYFYGDGFFITTQDGITWENLTRIDLSNLDSGITTTSDGTFIMIYPEQNKKTI